MLKDRLQERRTIGIFPCLRYQALFDKSLSGSERVCGLLKMLGENREVPLELDRSWIRIN